MTKSDFKILEIEKYLGVKLKKCNCFEEKKEYFNIYLDNPIYESQLHLEIERMCKNTSILSDVQPNGYKRLALFY